MIRGSHIPADLRDRWQTPIEIFDWVERRTALVADLAADESNHMLPKYYTAQDDALSRDWTELKVPNPQGRQQYGQFGWVNPPYSNIDPWLEHAYHMALQGFGSVHLIPTPNGEDRYGDWVFGKASLVVMITGRIAFIAPESFTIAGKGKPDRVIKKGQPVPGNSRGSCLVFYSPLHSSVRPGTPLTVKTEFAHVRRDAIYQESLQHQQRYAGHA